MIFDLQCSHHFCMYHSDGDKNINILSHRLQQINNRIINQ